jgi:prefoldin subunit 5
MTHTKGEKLRALEREARELERNREANIRNSIKQIEEGLARLDKIIENIQHQIHQLKRTPEE